MPRDSDPATDPATRPTPPPRSAVPAAVPATAIVTGGESGIGRATALALAAAGMDVGITWFTDERAAAAVAREIERAGRRGRGGPDGRHPGTRVR